VIRALGFDEITLTTRHFQQHPAEINLTKWWKEMPLADPIGTINRAFSVHLCRLPGTCLGRLGMENTLCGPGYTDGEIDDQGWAFCGGGRDDGNPGWVRVGDGGVAQTMTDGSILGMRSVEHGINSVTSASAHGNPMPPLTAFLGKRSVLPVWLIPRISQQSPEICSPNRLSNDNSTIMHPY